MEQDDRDAAEHQRELEEREQIDAMLNGDPGYQAWLDSIDSRKEVTWIY
tara:strand:- start:253 stop:399 length:147 start_codon:yes stop_codon:yes gene_type:complete